MAVALCLYVAPVRADEDAARTPSRGLLKQGALRVAFRTAAETASPAVFNVSTASDPGATGATTRH